MSYNHLLTSLKPFARRFIRREWSIGIYQGTSPFNLRAADSIQNPVLTARDVTDIKACMVADPFMIFENDIWYMFFEVMDEHDHKGRIGLATSHDGLNWDYQKIVLDEPFHLSYPYVFKWKGDYYMVPESYQDLSIRLYQATSFPDQWSFVKHLLSGHDYVDSSIFQFDARWWLFTTSASSDHLRLFYTDGLMDPWTEHPESPVIQQNMHIARPGGRVIVMGDRIFRYTQDDEPHYGHQVQAFEITQLTTTQYQEKEVQTNPIVKASGSGWNQIGMHHVDPHQIASDEWIACVDGCRMKIVF